MSSRPALRRQSADVHTTQEASTKRTANATLIRMVAIGALVAHRGLLAGSFALRAGVAVRATGGCRAASTFTRVTSKSAHAHARRQRPLTSREPCAHEEQVPSSQLDAQKGSGHDETGRQLSGLVVSPPAAVVVCGGVVVSNDELLLSVVVSPPAVVVVCG